jgi:cysteine-rich repeat protein
MRIFITRTSVVLLAFFFAAALTGATPALAILNSCGDGIVWAEDNETCDPPGQPVYTDGPICRADCTYCGDDVVDAGEECDDGNNVAGDGCSPICTFCTGEIGDFVWNDGVLGRDCDGIQPVDSSHGLNMLTVYLIEEPSGDLLQSVMTHNYGGIDGYYLFSGLCAGDYRVVIDAPGGMFFAPSMVGDPATDSNGHPAFLTLPTDDTSNLTIDFGFCTDIVAEGCTPGYWKNHLDAWDMTAYTPATLVGSVFDLPTNFASLGSATLEDALHWSNGRWPINSARNLIKHATAALLSTTHPDVNYEWTMAHILNEVNAALATENKNTMNNLATDIDDMNNSGCPLNGRRPRVDKQVERDRENRRGLDSRLDRRESDRVEDLQLN